MRILAIIAFLVAGILPDAAAAAQPVQAEAAGLAWWGWSLALFLVTFLIGIVAVLAGIGGGVMFVPIVGALFPFHLDFVRSAGLLLALAGALAAGPGLLSGGMASLRLALPFALVGSVFSVAGALLSFAIPGDAMQAMLGITILAMVVLMWYSAGPAAVPAGGDRISVGLGLAGVYVDPVTGREVNWQVQHTGAGLATFAIIGLVGGMFGLGAGWANVPALNLLMSIPLKGAVATSTIVMSMVNTSAAWIYIERGAVLPLLTVPSILGVMLGARLGARLLPRMPAAAVRHTVIIVLLLAGSRALLKGLGIWS